MKKNKVILTGFLTVLLVFSCTKNPETHTGNDELINKSFLQNVKTTRAVLKTQEYELTLTGKVEYNPDKVIRYVPLTSGIVDRVYFSIGDKVEAGQVLFDLRSTELSQLQAEELSLKSEAKIAEREMTTARSLYMDNMLSEKELFEAEAQLNQVKASLKRIQTDMSFYHYNYDKGTFSVISPMSGYIVDRNISSGSTISGDGDPIFTIADLSTVWIMANVYAKDLMFVHEGMDAEIELLSYPDQVFYGKIARLSNVFDKDERTLKARIPMNNENLLFKPEMSAVIKLKNKSHKELIAIPSEALVFDENHYYVVVQNAGDTFEVRQVELNNQSNGTTYIRSGLSAGEEVVIKNQLLIYSEFKSLQISPQGEA